MIPVGILAFCATSVIEAARTTGSLRDGFAQMLDAEDLSTVTAPTCGNSPEPKDYFFDLPGRTVDDSAAVRLIRNPSDPWLEVSNGAVWNVKADVDNAGRIIPSTILFEGRGKNGLQKRPDQYNLKSDMLYMKKRIENGVMWVEIKMKGCGAGPTRPGRGPTRPGRGTPRPGRTGGSKGHGKGKGHGKSHGKAKGKRHSHGSLLEKDMEETNSTSDTFAFVALSSNDSENLAASVDDIPALVELYEVSDGRAHEGKGKGKGKNGRHSRGSRGSKGSPKGPTRPGRAAHGPQRPSRATGECKPLTFADGTFYPQSGIKNALKNEANKGKTGGWIKPSQSVKKVGMAPSLGKGLFGALGFGTLGFLAVFPVTWGLQEGGIPAGPIGLATGAVVSGGVAMYRSWRSRPATASEKLYEKLHCLTKVKTCNGKACFRTCHDAKGNEAIVPSHSEPGDGIRC